MSENKTSDDEEKRLLVVSAHPDDIEFGVAGSVAKWIREGWQVSYVIATRGEHGAYDAKTDISKYAQLRESEARKAAEITGVSEITFLGYIDSKVQYTEALQKDIARQFRRVRPHRMICMDPRQLPAAGFINHPDHRRVARAALDVSLMAGTTASIFPELELEEGLVPWRDCKGVFIMGPAGGEEIVDITETIEIKLEALMAHESQNTKNVIDMVRERCRLRGEPAGYAYGESFQLVTGRFETSQ